MENPFSEDKQPGSAAQRFLDVARVILDGLGKLDPNPPHEGRLRHSVMPVEYMHIPDDASALAESE